MTIPSQVLVKLCSVCGKSKELSDYYIRTNGQPQGACKPCFRERLYKTRNANRKEYRRKYNAWNTAFKAKVRKEVFEAYGGFACVCCGEPERKFLTLDHINNDGAKDRMKIAGKRTASGWTTYLHLYRRGFPKGYQVLCMNCNFGKRMNNGVCPHKERCNDYPERE